MWYSLHQFDTQEAKHDPMVDLEAGETDERVLIRRAQERDGALIARLVRRLKVVQSTAASRASSRAETAAQTAAGTHSPVQYNR